MSGHRGAWPSLVAGALLAALVAAFGFIYDGWLLPADVVEGRRWYSCRHRRGG